MIPYELAKKLKDAGFPQEMKDGSMLDDGLNNEGYGPETAYDPTLSELIEACGESFVMLGHRGSGWFSESISNIGNGTTPEEAVANLWLELNKK